MHCVYGCRVPYDMERAHPLTEGQHLPATTDTWSDGAATWVLTMFWQVVEGRPECIGIELTSTTLPDQPPPALGMPIVGAPLTTNVVRDLRIGERIRAQRAKIAAQYAGPAVSGTAMRRATRERLEEAAAVYREAFARGDRPTVAVAEHFGISSGGASNLVVRARAIGLLPPTSPGAPQG